MAQVERYRSEEKYKIKAWPEWVCGAGKC
jgi:hypothetical protein